MEPAPPWTALDIETTGLDPTECKILAVGLVDGAGSRAIVGDAEYQILIELENLVSQSPSTFIVTWNGSEFDLPFLSTRYRLLGISTGLRTAPTGRVGKYGNPVVNATWGLHAHWDIADDYKAIAEQLSVPWHLKPVARALLGADPLEVDDIGTNISKLSRRELASYVLSDAHVTYDLAKLQRGPYFTATDQATLRSHQ